MGTGNFLLKKKEKKTKKKKEEETRKNKSTSHGNLEVPQRNSEI